MKKQEVLDSIKSTDVFCSKCQYDRSADGYGGRDCSHDNCFEWRRDKHTGEVIHYKRILSAEEKNKKFDCPDHKEVKGFWANFCRDDSIICTKVV